MRRVTGARRGDRNLALDRLVGDEAAQAELQRTVVPCEALRGINDLSAPDFIRAVPDIDLFQPALDDLDGTDARNISLRRASQLATLPRSAATRARASAVSRSLKSLPTGKTASRHVIE